jgi:hypothetical protein
MWLLNIPLHPLQRGTKTYLGLVVGPEDVYIVLMA